MAKKQVRNTTHVPIDGLNRCDMEAFASALVRRQFTTDEMLAYADSIPDKKLRKYFIKELQKRIEAKQSGSHNQNAVSQTNPPRSAQFALLLIPKRNREHLIGDLQEEYRTIVLPQYGRFLAGFWYWVQAAIAIGCYAWPTVKKILGLSFILKLIGR